MTALNVGVVCLAAGLVIRVGRESFVCRCGAGGEGLGVEFGGVVLRAYFAAELVLFYVSFLRTNSFGNGGRTPPCSCGCPVGWILGLNSPCLLVAMELTLLSSLILDVFCCFVFKKRIKS